MRHSLDWQIATIKAIKPENATVKTFTLVLPNWSPHSYQAQRSYSIASEPERGGEIDLTIELLEDGEVSSYMHDVVVVGDQVEVRGPIGGYFVWQAAMGGPLLLVAGGSGVVPLMAMIRHRVAAGSQTPARLLYSSRTLGDVIYAKELQRLQNAGDELEIVHTLTRQQPPGWSGYARRIDNQMLAEVIAPLGKEALAYVCGPTLMVEAVANGLVQIGLAPNRIRTERFGPTGGTA
jgi:ferredoxin-NADP reductase